MPTIPLVGYVDYFGPRKKWVRVVIKREDGKYWAGKDFNIHFEFRRTDDKEWDGDIHIIPFEAEERLRRDLDEAEIERKAEAKAKEEGRESPV